MHSEPFVVFLIGPADQGQATIAPGNSSAICP
jgi:hypothetical protein